MESDKEAKLVSDIELEKLKQSFKMKHLELMGQLELQRASFKTELEKAKAEPETHHINRSPKIILISYVIKKL